MTFGDRALAMASRVSFERCGEHTLCLLDFSGVQSTDVGLAAIAEARCTIAGQQPLSLRVLIDVSGSRLSRPLFLAMEELARANAPYVVRSAIFGLSLPQRVSLRQLRRLTGRDIREFTTR